MSQREQFEAWARKQYSSGFAYDDGRLFECHDGEYIDPQIDGAWEGWQAAIAQAPAVPKRVKIDRATAIIKSCFGDGGRTRAAISEMRLESGLKPLSAAPPVPIADRDAIIEECAKVADAQFTEESYDTDRAYNAAVDHCAAAIRAIKTPAEGEKA